MHSMLQHDPPTFNIPFVDFENYIDTAKAAEELGVKATTVTAYLRDESHPLQGKKFGRSWMVYKPSIEVWKQAKKPMGWEKGRKRK